MGRDPQSKVPDKMKSDDESLEQESKAAKPPPSLMDLPSDLHVQLLSHLEYPDLEMLRGTNSYFRHLPSDLDIAHSRSSYVQTLLQQEQQEVSYAHSLSFSPDPNDVLAADTNNYFLRCYFCFRRKHISNFTGTQFTQRRSKGHADAGKRFCTSCGVRDRRWEPGTILSTPREQLVYCRRCRELKPLSSASGWRSFGFCEECALYLRLPRCGHATYQTQAEMEENGGWADAKAVFDYIYQVQRGKGSRDVVSEEAWAELRERISELRCGHESQG